MEQLFRSGWQILTPRRNKLSEGHSNAEDTRGRKPDPIFDLKNLCRFSTPKTDMAEKKDDDAVAAAIMHLCSCKS